jgi:hypothetical protein
MSLLKQDAAEAGCAIDVPVGLKLTAAVLKLTAAVLVLVGTEVIRAEVRGAKVLYE